MPHCTQQLLLELFAIFVVAKPAGELFERLRLPAVLSEILAGVAVGPPPWMDQPQPRVLLPKELNDLQFGHEHFHFF